MQLVLEDMSVAYILSERLSFLLFGGDRIYVERSITCPDMSVSDQEPTNDRKDSWKRISL